MNGPFIPRSERLAYHARVNRAVVLLLLLSTWAADPAWAQAEHEQVRRDVQSGKLKPLAEILQGVQQRHRGRIVDIDLERGADGRSWYEIKIQNGQRMEVYVDAETGREIPRPDAFRRDLMPMAAVARRVLDAHPGLVLQVELEDADGSRPYYEFKLLGRNGRELLVRADARTGGLLAEPPVQPALAARLLPLPQLLESLEKRYDARATEAELKFGRNRRGYYEVELQTRAGRSVEVHVDALSGDLVDEAGLR